MGRDLDEASENWLAGESQANQLGSRSLKQRIVNKIEGVKRNTVLREKSKKGIARVVDEGMCQ